MRHQMESVDSRRLRAGRSLKAALLVSALAFAPAHAMAQETDPDEDADAVEEALQDPNTIVVVGDIARTIENSLETKRDLSVIGDAIVGEDVGDLPDLSVAETLERIVGVTSDRFKGGAPDRADCLDANQ